jgi:hypothetical protein
MKRLYHFLSIMLVSLALVAGPGTALADSLVLSGVPEYLWYHGCSPTAGGMLMGYWAEHGYAGLLPGVTNPMVQSQAVDNDISSAAHNAQDTYQGHPANCIADFMQTVSGGTDGPNIASGLANWTTYVGLSVQTAAYSNVSFYGGTFNYAAFTKEINAGRPMILNLFTDIYGSIVGHSVLAYGYQDNMFNLRIKTGTGYQNVTVPGFAVMDTWENGVGPWSQAAWENWQGNAIYSQLDGKGVEWWPFLDLTMSYGYDFSILYDWEIFSAVSYNPVSSHTPVPPTLVLLGSGVLVLLKRRPKMIE